MMSCFKPDERFPTELIFLKTYALKLYLLFKHCTMFDSNDKLSTKYLCMP